jgi:hypothetical protein
MLHSLSSRHFNNKKYRQFFFQIALSLKLYLAPEIENFFCTISLINNIQEADSDVNRQGMLTPPRHLIPSLTHSEVNVRNSLTCIFYRICEIDNCSLIIPFMWWFIIKSLCNERLYLHTDNFNQNIIISNEAKHTIGTLQCEGRKLIQHGCIVRWDNTMIGFISNIYIPRLYLPQNM